MSFDLLKEGLSVLIQPMPLLYVFAGVVMGVVFGALPGVSATMAVVLCITFTYSMSPLVAIAFMVAVYCSSITGGGITAILFRIPGTPASAATTFDGYPIAERGEAGRALGISLYASAFGGLFSAVCMYALTMPLMKVALKFGSAEQFALALFGLSIMAFMDKENRIKTFASGLMGLFFATIGVDTLTSVNRFTLGSKFLLNGIETIPAMVGIFAVAEVIKQITKQTDRSQFDDKKLSKLVSLKEMWTMKWTMLRCAIIGTFVGIVPGAGATIASFLGYSTEVKLSKHPEQFGHGAPEGVAASEAANNAATGGAMVPLLSLGIPGGSAAAMMMTALLIHGVQMGPLLMQQQPEYVSVVFIAMLIANIAMVVVSIFVAKGFARILRIPYSLLGVIILLLSTIGAYASSKSMNEVYFMVIFGIFGYFFNKYKFNHAALVLGLVLGELCERNFRRAMQLVDNNIFAIVSRPITAAILAVIVLMFVWPVISKRIKKVTAKDN